MGLKTWLGLKPRRDLEQVELGSAAQGSERRIAAGLPDPTFPIDIVYTWVDGDDPEHRERLLRYLPEGDRRLRNVAGAERYVSRNELLYSLRSVAAYAPWVNRIYIVTDGQRPTWLAEHPKVTIVAHDRILDAAHLPTFNSHAIESALHKIPGLREHYVYFNDDVMLLRPLAASEVFTAGGVSINHLGGVTLPAGPPLPQETATAWGAKNARDLIVSKWGRCVERRFSHMYHPQRKSVAEDCERLFEGSYEACRRNRFRAMDDILTCGFLHPMAQHMTGCGIITGPSLWYLKIRERSALRLYRRMLSDRGTTRARAALCANDTPAPRRDALPDFESRLAEFLAAYYPMSSAFEKSGAP